MTISIWRAIKAEIKFVRHYKSGREDLWDVVYQSRRCYTYYGTENLPKTVWKFLEGKEPKVQMDKLHGEEFIYE